MIHFLVDDSLVQFFIPRLYQNRLSTVMMNMISRVTGQRINELENAASSYPLKMEYFGSNRVGFDIVRNFDYKTWTIKI